MKQGAFVFVGSPSSNPWVSYFQDKLNFQEREGKVGESLKFFQNLHPKVGEQETYHGLTFTGSSGEDYATISLLPLPMAAAAFSSCRDCNKRAPNPQGFFWPTPATGKSFRRLSAFWLSGATVLLRSTHSHPGRCRRPQCDFHRGYARDSSLSLGKPSLCALPKHECESKVEFRLRELRTGRKLNSTFPLGNSTGRLRARS